MPDRTSRSLELVDGIAHDERKRDLPFEHLADGAADARRLQGLGHRAGREALPRGRGRHRP